ncbi:EAL domain-containing protein [Rhodobacteraceae bacterium]|nr:EAL domain-containing protein [Paracoccaceae bacterium]
MLLEDVISNFPIITADAVAIGYRPSDDRDWEIAWVNDGFCAMFRADHLEALGRHPNDIHHPDYLMDFLEHVEEMEAAGRTHLSIGSRCVCDDGAEFWASVSLFVIWDEEGNGRHCVLNIRDVNDLKDREQAAELALIENEQLLFKVEAAQTRLISALEATSDPFVIFDARDKLVIWNPAFDLSITDDPNVLKKGMKLVDVLRLGAENGRFPEAVGRVDDWLAERMKVWNSPDISDFLVNKNNRDYKVVVTRTKNGDRVLLQNDITEFLHQQNELKRYTESLEHSNQKFSYQAFHDELTGLGNRRYLNVKLEEMSDARRESGGEIATLHVDLDRFKHVNDTMGHAAGDHVLEVVSERLRAVLRSSDIVARTGGDEFVILIACKVESDEPERIADRVIDELARPVTFEGRPCDFGASVGIARTPLIETDELLTSSDIALYKAKTAGRGRVGIFDSSDLEQLHGVKNLASDIRLGLEDGAFRPAYWPEIDPETGRIMGLSVSALWHHPERGLLTPRDFLESADAIRLRSQIDKAVFDRAFVECQTALGEDDQHPDLSFSIGHGLFVDETFLHAIQAQNSPSDISLELTETTFLEDETVGFLRSVEDLRGAGAKLVVDAFGSGRGSVVALRRLSPDRIKIDHRLVESVAQSESAVQMVRSIATLAQTLNIGVTATGVDTDAQAHALVHSGCDRHQGDLYGGWMALEELTTFMEAQKTWSRSA